MQSTASVRFESRSSLSIDKWLAVKRRSTRTHAHTQRHSYPLHTHTHTQADLPRMHVEHGESVSFIIWATNNISLEGLFFNFHGGHAPYSSFFILFWTNMVTNEFLSVANSWPTAWSGEEQEEQALVCMNSTLLARNLGVFVFDSVCHLQVPFCLSPEITCNQPSPSPLSLY